LGFATGPKSLSKPLKRAAGLTQGRLWEAEGDRRRRRAAGRVPGPLQVKELCYRYRPGRQAACDDADALALTFAQRVAPVRQDDIRLIPYAGLFGGEGRWMA
jgi:hypothetical protein